MSTLRVAVLHPDRLSIYGDRANLRVLQRRCEWRDIGFEVRAVGFGDDLDPDVELVYLSGGQDPDQLRCGRDLVEHKGAAVRAAVDRGAAVLGICGGYQLLGRSVVIGEDEIPGLGLVDAATDRNGPRIVGHVAAAVDLGDRSSVLTGYQNHVGLTHLGADARPLGRVPRGFGNDGIDGTEGVLVGRVVGTYVRGPVFALNVWLADWLIASALGIAVDDLAPLDDRYTLGAHERSVALAGEQAAPA